MVARKSKHDEPKPDIAHRELQLLLKRHVLLRPVVLHQRPINPSLVDNLQHRVDGVQFGNDLLRWRLRVLLQNVE